MLESFPYIQFENNMPDIVASQEFINLVNEFSPSYIVNIGGQSLLIDACSSIVPVLNINTVASDITMTEATALMIGRQPVRADADFLSLINKTTDYIIPGCFSFDIKKSNCIYTRDQLHIPKDRFVLVIVGKLLVFGNAE